MTGAGSGESAENLPHDRRTERKGRLRMTSLVVAVVAAIDVVIFTIAVPWADEISRNPMMSLGYVVTFLTVFVNFLVALGLVAYVFHGDSYPSDRWK